jgi:hypothetical protein
MRKKIREKPKSPENQGVYVRRSGILSFFAAKVTGILSSPTAIDLLTSALSLSISQLSTNSLLLPPIDAVLSQ